MPNNSRNYIFIGFAVLVIGAAFFLLHHPKSSSPVVAGEVATSSNVAVATTTNTGSKVSAAPSGAANTSTPSNSNGLLHGMVDLHEIGGTGLSVDVLSRVSSITDTGVFAAMPVATNTVTIVTVRDASSSPRAYGVAFPDTATITLDARSTAEATLIDPTADLATAHKELSEINGLQCFPAYVAYLQKELPTYSLDQIQAMTSPNDASNPHNACINEIKAMVATGK